MLSERVDLYIFNYKIRKPLGANIMRISLLRAILPIALLVVACGKTMEAGGEAKGAAIIAGAIVLFFVWPKIERLFGKLFR